MFLFWIITWAVSFLLFLLIPLCCVPDNRTRLYLRVTLMKWNVEVELAQAAALAGQDNNPTGVTTGAVPASAAADADSDSNFHYVLSRAQEDEIRESFLTEKLQKYTFTLAPSSIQRLRSDTMATATSSTSVDSGGDGGGTEPNDSSSSSPYGDDNEADLEEAAASTFQHPPNTDCHVDDVVNKETTATEDCCSSDDGLSDDGLILEMDEFFDDSSMIILPHLSGGGGGGKAGGNKNAKSPVRQVPNGCAICLTAMDAGDRIAFSSDPKCNHIFHEGCMKDWLVASGRKFLKRQRREARNHSSSESGVVYRYNCHNPIETILSFPMLCPCCRQPFVNKVEEDDSDDDDDDDNLAKTSKTTAAGMVITEPVVDIEAPPVEDAADDDVGEEQPSSSADADEPTTTSTAVAAAVSSTASSRQLDVPVGSGGE